MTFILKMAWRDSRASRKRLLLFSLSVVLGIAALVAIGSWSERDETVSLAMDLKAMGLAGDVRVYAPAVSGLQAFAEVDPSSVLVPARQGLFLMVVPKADKASPSGPRLPLPSSR